MENSVFGLHGKTAFITGASRGIGRSIALGYAAAGADLVLVARSADSLHEVAADAERRGVRVLTQACDLAEPTSATAAFERALDTFGDIDILVNNAGTLDSAGPFLQLTEDDWNRITRVNFDAPVRLLRLFGNHATARGSGTAITMSSVAGLAGVPVLSHYAALKAALGSLSKSLSAEWASSGVRVNVLAPGWIDTQFIAPLSADPTLSEGLLHAVPDGRWGDSQDIVGAALWLASDSARMVTGACITIDGGMTAYNGGPAMLDLLSLGRMEIG